MIDVHYVATANGMKVAIALEEMGLPYRVTDYPLFAGKHLTSEFRKLNPNNKLPVIVDNAPSFRVPDRGSVNPSPLGDGSVR